MGRSMSKMVRNELLITIRDRYQHSTRKDKGRILDEFTAVTGLHRKHSIRLLAGTDEGDEREPSLAGRRIYDEAVREAVIVVWEASDRICGKRLKAALPHLWLSPWSATGTCNWTPWSGNGYLPPAHPPWTGC